MGSCGGAAGSGLGDATARPCRAAARAWALAAIGGAALLIGLAVYLSDRVPARVALLAGLPIEGGRHGFGTAGQWLPSFVHPFAFALFTVAALDRDSRWRYPACAAWGAVDVAAEAGQHPLLSSRLADAIHAHLGHGGIADAVAGYFAHGTFDRLDVAAAMLGAIAAGLAVRMLQPTSGARHGT